MKYPLVNSLFAIQNGHRFIVDLPMKNDDFPELQFPGGYMGDISQWYFHGKIWRPGRIMGDMVMSY